METIKVDSIAFCASGVDAPLHPWAIHTAMQFRAVPPPDQSSSTVDPQGLGTVVSASRKHGIVLQLPDNTRVRISDEQLITVNYSCPDGSDSRDQQWGCLIDCCHAFFDNIPHDHRHFTFALSLYAYHHKVPPSDPPITPKNETKNSNNRSQ
jgi:hypothetical protein